MYDRINIKSGVGVIGLEKVIKGDQLEKIKHFLSMRYYDSVVKESCAILEEILKKIYKQALSELPIDDRTALLESEGKIGNGNKSYTRFGFGELVGLFNRSRLLDRWSKYTDNNMGIIRSISLDYIVELRNRLTHDRSSMQEEVSQSEAQLVYDCLLNWLSFIGYKDMSTGVESAFKQPSTHAEPSAKATTYQRVKKDITSGYDSSIKPERRRLKKQAAYSEQHDAHSFEYALERLNHKKDLIGLDVGCADGYVTELRFKEEYGFKKVVGIDHNKTLIEKVRSEDHGIFHYHFVDIEARSFDDDMEDLLEEEGIEAFDVMFCALTLHHLKNPARLLRKLRRYLRKGGALIIRGVDDGAMIAYDDGGLVEEILDDCTRQSNASDRYHGRKYYPWLRSVGFSDIKMNYQVDDITEMDAEEREDFFHYYFDFRLQYTLRPLNKDPENPRFIQDHERMVANLDKLEAMFIRPDFFFSTLTVSCIAIK